MDVVSVQYLKQIVKNLKLWRESRRLTIEMQQEGFVNNFNEEVQEYNDATSPEEKIDALCDMAVFVINCWDLTMADIEYIELRLSKLITQSKAPLKLLKTTNIVKNKKTSIDQLAYLFTEMHNMGYDPYVSMDETIREIRSRTGSYNEEKKKWIKDTSPEAQSKWYKADYKSARLGIDKEI